MHLFFWSIKVFILKASQTVQLNTTHDTFSVDFVTL